MIGFMARLRAWSLLSVACLAMVSGIGVERAEAQARPLVIRSDPGGLLGVRSKEIRRLRASGARVELRGTCNSACTLYLGLANVCVDRRASFGFHGPSRYGKALPPAQFEHWSAVMADSYKEPLRSWFMTTARYEISGHIRLSGAELIRLGYAEC